MKDIERQIYNQEPMAHAPRTLRPTSAAQQRMMNALEALLVDNFQA